MNELAPVAIAKAYGKPDGHTVEVDGMWRGVSQTVVSARVDGGEWRMLDFDGFPDWAAALQRFLEAAVERLPEELARHREFMDRTEVNGEEDS